MPSPRDTLYGMLCCLLLLTSEQSSAGKLFEWIDNNGAPHFSDRAPVGLPFAEKSFSSALRTPESGNEPGIREAERILLENVQRQHLEIDRAKQAVAQQVEQRKVRCKQARALYHQAIHRPGTAGSNDFRMYRQKMNEACD
jgi:hypothetical protein